MSINPLTPHISPQTSPLTSHPSLLTPHLTPHLTSHLTPHISPPTSNPSPLTHPQDFPENVGSPYWNLLSVEVTRADATRSVITGAVFGSVPHIVRVDDYVDLLSFKPEGNYILTFRNEDKPGVISEVLQILSNANVNVASLNCSKATADGKKAIAFMALDNDVPTNSMTALRSLAALENVAKIQLH